MFQERNKMREGVVCVGEVWGESVYVMSIAIDEGLCSGNRGSWGEGGLFRRGKTMSDVFSFDMQTLVEKMGAERRTEAGVYFKGWPLGGVSVGEAVGRKPFPRHLSAVRMIS